MIKANSLSSSNTQLSFDYYSLPFCEPHEGIIKDSESLGERLSGDSIDNTPYEINMLQDKKCALLCKKLIQENNWIHLSANQKWL